RPGEPLDAIARYSEAQSSLQKFQQMYPAWNTKVFAFRLNYLAAKVGENTAVKPEAAAPKSEIKEQKADSREQKAPPVIVSTSPRNPPQPQLQPQPPAASQTELNDLKDQLRQLQADKLRSEEHT